MSRQDKPKAVRQAQAKARAGARPGRRVGAVNATLRPNSQASLAAVISTSVRATPGPCFGISAFNNGAAAAYVRLYDQATAPAAGDGANILWRGMIPAGGSLLREWSNPIAFNVGIGVRVTGAAADADATALAANQVLLNVEVM